MQLFGGSEENFPRATGKVVWCDHVGFFHKSVAQVEGCTEKTLKAGFFGMFWVNLCFTFQRYHTDKGDLDSNVANVAGKKTHVRSEAQSCFVYSKC